MGSPSDPIQALCQTGKLCMLRALCQHNSNMLKMEFALVNLHWWWLSVALEDSQER